MCWMGRSLCIQMVKLENDMCPNHNAPHGTLHPTKMPYPSEIVSEGNRKTDLLTTSSMTYQLSTRFSLQGLQRNYYLSWYGSIYVFTIHSNSAKTELHEVLNPDQCKDNSKS
jgi:hypothetical protein